MCVCIFPVLMYVHYINVLCPQSQKSVLHLLELKLHIVVNHHVNPGN